ncbi:MAG: FAD-dependent oxidoreductase [Pirellulaceae bacterium]
MGVFQCTWGIDTHSPHPDYSAGHKAGDEVLATFTHGEGYTYEGPYWAPYRCLYSRNINNLFMAGRDISVTHEGLGAVRVMKTCGTMGEIVGFAASICKIHACTPREVYERYLDDLKRSMRVGAGRSETVAISASDATVLSGESAKLRGKALKFEAALDCVGYWRNSGDFAEWKLRSSAATKYRMEILVACSPENANGSGGIILEAAESATNSKCDFTIPSTGSWEDFRWFEVGELELPEGESLLTVVNQKTTGPLMKLRSVRLKPIE